MPHSELKYQERFNNQLVCTQRKKKTSEHVPKKSVEHRSIIINIKLWFLVEPLSNIVNQKSQESDELFDGFSKREFSNVVYQFFTCDVKVAWSITVRHSPLKYKSCRSVIFNGSHKLLCSPLIFLPKKPHRTFTDLMSWSIFFSIFFEVLLWSSLSIIP